MSLCIALDAMGGDHGPRVVVPAAIEALSLHPELVIILVGDPTLIEPYLRQAGVLHHPRLRIQLATQVVLMDDAPALALRKKTDSSMRVALNLVKTGQAHACVSAGNTGALMATARYVLKMLPGVDRPAIVYALPTMTGHVHVLDLGANVDCQPKDLVQFALMGSILASVVDNHPEPRVGLLNVGSEAMKGSAQVKQAAELLKECASLLHYIGFVEGDDIYKGRADVVVCDGFVGNVALKVSEGLAKLFFLSLKEAFLSSFYGKCMAFLMKPILRRLRARLDPNRHNGASLLGLRGVVIKSHGSAETMAFGMAIRVAVLEAQKNLPEKIQEHLMRRLPLMPELSEGSVLP